MSDVVVVEENVVDVDVVEHSIGDVLVTQSPVRQVVATRTAARQVTLARASSRALVATTTERVDVRRLGIQGIQGLQGIPGMSGADPFVWVQDDPASVWTVVHNLATCPGVTVVDSGGRQIYGDVEYGSDLNSLTITFGSAFSGRAYLL